MNVLELFSGTASFSKVARERGHRTFTVDIEEKFEPDLVVDVIDLKTETILELFGQPHIIWASPPCQCFSETKEAVRTVQKTLSLITKLNPTFWIIENPRGMLRKMPFMGSIHRATITYCQYGDKNQKPTDLWHNVFSWIPKLQCGPGQDCHEAAPRGSESGVQSCKVFRRRVATVPALLCSEILDAIEGKQPVRQTILPEVKA